MILVVCDYTNHRTFIADTNLKNYPDFEVAWRAKMISPLADSNTFYFLNFGNEVYLDLQPVNGIEKLAG